MNISNCIICGSDENLNTEMTITVDDKKIAVELCDEHAEDTTPKIAREAYQAKQLEIDDIIEKAKALGLNIGPSSPSGKIVTVQQSEQPPQSTQAPAVPGANPALAGTRDDGILSTDEVDSTMRRIVGVSGAAGHASVESHGAHNPNDLQDRLPDGATKGKVKMGLAEGREGQPIAIPSVRQDGTGTTRIWVAKGAGDNELQRRFKANANSQGSDGANRHAFGQGYAVRPCTFCHGDGIIRVAGRDDDQCPKCDGSGFFSSEGTE